MPAASLPYCSLLVWITEQVLDAIRLCRIISLCIASLKLKLFSRLVADVLTDEEYSGLQKALIKDPEAGDLIPRSGGIRKLRWGVAGRGKRGGIRVIYYARVRRGQIWMLTLYKKNVMENIPANVLRQIKEEIDG